jgi:hypothetical protein
MMDTKVRTESTMSCQSWMVGKSWWVAQSTLCIKRRPTFCSMVLEEWLISCQICLCNLPTNCLYILLLWSRYQCW